MHLTSPMTLHVGLHACHIWPIDSLCHCNVGLLSLWILWPAMHLEISAWPMLIPREIRKCLEGAEGIFRQVGKGIAWVEAPCSQNLGTVCFLPDHLSSSSHERWPNHSYHLTLLIHSPFFILSSNNSPRGLARCSGTTLDSGTTSRFILQQETL